MIHHLMISEDHFKISNEFSFYVSAAFEFTLNEGGAPTYSTYLALQLASGDTGGLQVGEVSVLRSLLFSAYTWRHPYLTFSSRCRALSPARRVVAFFRVAWQRPEVMGAAGSRRARSKAKAAAAPSPPIEPVPATGSAAAAGVASSRFGPASRGARTLRWARVLYYGAWVPSFIYAMFVQLITLKGPGRTPLPASILFGGDTVLLTFHGNAHCTWYSALCLAHAFILLRRSTRAPPRRLSPLFRALERTAHRYSSPLFALGVFVGAGYYLLLHFLPITRIRARMIPDYDGKMALLHMGPMLFVIGDVLLKCADLSARHAMTPFAASRAIAMYGTVYFAWVVFCVSQNGGVWPYPFQPHLSATQHLIFVVASLLIGAYLARYSCGIVAGIDLRRRRRILLDVRTAAA